MVESFQVVQVTRYPPANARDARDWGSVPGSGRSSGEGKGAPLIMVSEHSEKSFSTLK